MQPMTMRLEKQMAMPDSAMMMLKAIVDPMMIRQSNDEFTSVTITALTGMSQPGGTCRDCQSEPFQVSKNYIHKQAMLKTGVLHRVQKTTAGVTQQLLD